MNKLSNYFYIFSKLTTSFILFLLIFFFGYALYNSYKDIDKNSKNIDGKFLSLEDLSYINYPSIQRCDKNSKLVIDLPPHNSEYFSLQMLGVKNYYESITNNFISFEINMLENTYELSESMAYYSTSDQKIGSLFSDEPKSSLRTSLILFKE